MDFPLGCFLQFSKKFSLLPLPRRFFVVTYKKYGAFGGFYDEITA